MATRKECETKNQHYVPQFYLRNFSIDKKNIGTYVLCSSQNVYDAPIKNQASDDYFYSKNLDIEKTLGKIESSANKVIDKIIQDYKAKLSDDDQEALFIFTVFQLGRTQSQAKYIQTQFATIVKTIVKKHFDILQKDSVNKNVAEIIEAEIDNIALKFDPPGMIALSTQAQLIDCFYDLEFKILVNNTKKVFITSDNPASMYDQFMERIGNRNYAFLSKGLQIFLPMSPSFGIMYYDPKCYKLGHKKKSYVEIIEENDIYELNKLTAANAETTIYYKKGSVSENDLEQYAFLNKKYRPKERIEVYSSGDNIIGTHNIPMFCKLSLSFIKELPAYKAISAQSFNLSNQFREIGDIVRDEVYKKLHSLLQLAEISQVNLGDKG